MVNAFLRRAWLFAVVVPLASCAPQLNPLLPLHVQVELDFILVHQNVTASWTGNRTASGEFPPNVFEDAATTAAESTSIGDVTPPLLVQFDTAEGLMPGYWSITITITAEGEPVQTIRCDNLDIGANSFQQAAIYTVRWVEGMEGCQAAPGLPRREPSARDAQARSITAPQSATLGDSVAVQVNVQNNGDLQEYVAVQLTASPPSGGQAIQIGSQLPLLAPRAATDVSFTWPTACIGPPGEYLLEATASVPAGDTTNNNSQTHIINLAADREISISNFAGPANASKSQQGGTGYTVRVVNGASQRETAIGVAFSDTPAPTGSPQWLLTVPPFDLECGETKQLFLAYFPSTLAPDDSVHTLTLTLQPATAIPGDSPSNNTASVTVTLTP